MTGVFLWHPRDFWRSTVYDCNLALRGHFDKIEREMERQANVTAQMINGMRDAQGKNFRAKQSRDFFRPMEDADATADRIDSSKAYREQVLKKAPQTLPHSHFTGGPSLRRPPKTEP